MKIQSKYMYGGKSTYRKGGYVPQTQRSREELDKKAYGPSKGPQRFTRKDVKPQTQMTNEELSKLSSGTKQSQITTSTTKTTTKNNKVNNKESKTSSKIYNLKNDKSWDYKVENNKWFARRKGTTKFFDLSKDKYKSAVEKLDKEHPNARTRTMEKGGTLMQRYAKAYQEGGTPDSLRNNLELYEKNFGKLPTFAGSDDYGDAGERDLFGDPIEFVKYMINNNLIDRDTNTRGLIDRMEKAKQQAERKYIANNWKEGDNPQEATPSDPDIKEGILSSMPSGYIRKYIIKNVLNSGNAYSDISRLYGRYRRQTKNFQEQLRKAKKDGKDVTQYDSYLKDPKAFNNLHYSGAYEKITAAKEKIKQRMRDKYSDEWKKMNPAVKHDPSFYSLLDTFGQDELSDAEQYLLGFNVQDDKGDIENESSLQQQLSKEYNITVTPQTRQLLNAGGGSYTRLSYYNAPELKKDIGTPNNNVETPLSQDKKTPSEQGSPVTITPKEPTKIKTQDDSELMANQKVQGPDESVDATTTDDSTVTETRGDTREKTTKEYIPQSMRNRMEEKKDPTDNKNTANNVVETSVNTNNNANVTNNNANVTNNNANVTNNNANVTSNTDTSTGDDFSGPNPYDYGSEEYFDWKKRKRAAMFAKRGALVKKINYLKGGIYGKGNFRR